MVYFGISITRSCVGDLRLAGKARGRLQPPGLVEQVLLLLLGGVERIEALRARSRGRWCRRRTSRRRARSRCRARAACRRSTRRLRPRSPRPCGQSACVRQHLQLGHQRLPILRPASARVMPASMRRAANSSVARFSASTACLIARWSVPASSLSQGSDRCVDRCALLRRSAAVHPRRARRASPRSGAGRRPAARPARARACPRCACSNESRSMRSTSASVRP